MPDDPEHSVVQIWNSDHTKFYASALTVPNYRRKPSGNPVVLFEHTQPGAPTAVQAWFYPGDVYGHDFVYPKSRATELAKLGAAGSFDAGRSRRQWQQVVRQFCE